jgi:pimeloyl-ACP methyl ester carboxylesterase
MTTVQLALSHRWRVPAHVFAVLTSDDVQIVGTRLGANEADRHAVVFVHGLMGWHGKPKFAVFAEHLTEWFTVYAFDMRGHGGSGGVSDYGGAEIHDIDAVVALARREGHGKVVAYWDWRGGADPLARRQLDARIGSRSGRAALRAWGVRLPEHWDEPESPEEVVGKIAPTPVAIIHGNDDHLFAPDHARRLYEAAGEPKRLLLGDRFGHAEDGLTPAFERRLARVVFEMLELPWSE